MYRDHRKGPGGPPDGATYPGGPHGLKWEGNQPLVGWCAPLAPLRLGLGTLGEGAPPLALGGTPPPLAATPPWEIPSQGGRRPRGDLPPKSGGAPPPPGFPTLGAGEAHGGRTSPSGAGSPPTSAHGALRGRWPHPVDPRDPFGGPSTIPVTPETFPMAETALPIYNSSPSDHSGTPRDVRDLIRDSEQHSVCCILIFIQP